MEICFDGSRSTFLALGTLSVMGLGLCPLPGRGSIYRSICVRVLCAWRSVHIECSRHRCNHSELASPALGAAEQYSDSIGARASVLIQMGMTMPPDERIEFTPFGRRARKNKSVPRQTGPKPGLPDDWATMSPGRQAVPACAFGAIPPKRPLSKSSIAWRISASLFITKGP